MAVEDSTFNSKFVILTENYKIQQYRIQKRWMFSKAYLTIMGRYP